MEVKNVRTNMVNHNFLYMGHSNCIYLNTIKKKKKIAMKVGGLEMLGLETWITQLHPLLHFPLMAMVATTPTLTLTPSDNTTHLGNYVD